MKHKLLYLTLAIFILTLSVHAQLHINSELIINGNTSTLIRYINNITEAKHQFDLSKYELVNNTIKATSNVTETIKGIWKTTYGTGFQQYMINKICLSRGYDIIFNNGKPKFSIENGQKCYTVKDGSFQIVKYHFPIKATTFLIFYILVIISLVARKGKKDQ